MKAKHPASKDCILGKGDGASKKPVVASRLCFATLSKMAMEESLHFSQPPKARAAVILSCDQSNIHREFRILVGGG